MYQAKDSTGVMWTFFEDNFKAKSDICLYIFSSVLKKSAKTVNDVMYYL